jgi:anaerobic magnesium-protoporphyrin IX monomethyl ester cyclase
VAKVVLYHIELTVQGIPEERGVIGLRKARQDASDEMHGHHRGRNPMNDILLLDTPMYYRPLPEAFAQVLRRSLIAQDLLYLRHHPHARLAKTKRQFSRGMLVIASYLRQRGLKVRYVNRPLVDDPEIQDVARCNRFVGLYAMTVSFPAVAELCSKLKYYNPGIVTVVGGPHASLADFDVLRCSDIDIVVRKAGEETLYELLTDYPNLTSVRGITYRDVGGRLHRNPDRLASDINTMPAYDMLEEPLSDYKYNILASRGCQGRCSFCLDWRLSSNVSSRSIEGVIDELSSLAEHLPRHEVIQFFDSIFTANPEFVGQLAHTIQAKDLGFYFLCDSTPTHLTPKVIHALDDAGFIGIKMGFESNDADTLAIAKKPASYRQYVEGAELVHKHSSALVTAYWLSGLPGTTARSLADAQKAIEVLLRDGVIDILSHKLFVPYPGTVASQHPDLFHGRIRTRDWRQYDRLLPNPVFIPDSLGEFDWASYVCEVESTALRIYCERLGLSERDLDGISEANSYKFGYCEGALCPVANEKAVA